MKREPKWLKNGKALAKAFRAYADAKQGSYQQRFDAKMKRL